MIFLLTYYLPPESSYWVLQNALHSVGKPDNGFGLPQLDNICRTHGYRLHSLDLCDVCLTSFKAAQRHSLIWRDGLTIQVSSAMWRGWIWSRWSWCTMSRWRVEVQQEEKEHSSAVPSFIYWKTGGTCGLVRTFARDWMVQCVTQRLLMIRMWVLCSHISFLM